MVINMLSFTFSFDDLLLIFCYISKECFIKQYQFYKECRGMSMCPTEAYSFFFSNALDFFFLDFQYFALFLTGIICCAY